MIQVKTGKPVVITMNPIALQILERQRTKRDIVNPEDVVFDLPTLNGANKMLDCWVKDAGIDKYFTWSCARLSFSVLLQDKRVDLPLLPICWDILPLSRWSGLIKDIVL